MTPMRPAVIIVGPGRHQPAGRSARTIRFSAGGFRHRGLGTVRSRHPPIRPPSLAVRVTVGRGSLTVTVKG